MGNLNIQLKDGANNLYPVTKSDNVVLENVTPVANPSINIIEGTDVNGMTLTEFMNAAYGERHRLAFLHISDTHGGTAGVAEMASLADAEGSDIDFIVHTGDFGAASFNAFVSAECTKPKLGVWGNHDTYDTYSRDTQAAATAMRSLMGSSDVSYGSETASYWYKDITTESGENVRIIGFDEYEDASEQAYLYQGYYTQEQIDWFIGLLKDTPSTYYILLLHHMAVEDTVSDNAGEFKSSHLNSTSNGFYKGTQSASLIPSIINAYLNRASIAASDGGITVDEDFSETVPATFLAHIGGHKHSDCCEPLVNYPAQIQLLIAKGHSGASGGGDLTFADSSYCINKVIIDFNLRQVRVQRIGAQQKSNETLRVKTDFHY